MNVKLNCPECAKFMIATETETKREHGILIELRAYSSKKAHSSYGMLTIPTKEYEECCDKIRVVFENIFPEIKHQLDILKHLNRVIGLANFSKNTCLQFEHNNMISNFILIGLIRFSIKNINTAKKIANKN